VSVWRCASHKKKIIFFALSSVFISFFALFDLSIAIVALFSLAFHTSLTNNPPTMTMTLRLSCFFAALFFTFTANQLGDARVLTGDAGLCVIGCTPYVDPFRARSMDKYHALVDEMARTCDIIVHVGDTKAGQAPCNQTHMTQAVHMLTDLAKQHQTLVLYALGDNEVNDCHRHQSAPLERRQPSEFVRAIDARQFLVQDFKINSGKDLTGRYNVQQHVKSGYNCDFDKYVEFDDYAVATLEVIGSHWYLDVRTQFF
jgi:hypothetical protein